MVFGLFAIVGFVLGGILAWLTATARVTKFLSIQINEYDRRANSAEGRASGLEVTISDLRSLTQRGSEELASVRGELTNESNARVKAETQLKEAFLRLEEEKKLLEDAKASLSDTFKALAGDTLRSSTSEFLKLAKETIDNVMTEAKGDLGQRQEVIRGLVKPLSDSLSRFDEHVRSIEKDRQEAYAGLTEQVKGLATGQQQLQRETANLVTALRKPQVRGRWGELTLRRVVELAGMSEHCDFAEQVSAETEEGRQRPDLIVKLPADREIVVDAKVSLDAYLDATEADSEESRKSAMSRHAAQLRSHMNALAEKRYWSQFTKAPEFVVMFIPGESFFGAAVDADPTIIEDGLEKKVILATPTTFIALLKAVAYGWRQDLIAKNAQQISDLGRQLYERMKTMTEHIGEIGKGLEKANNAYNSAVGSIEARVLPAARRFKDLGAVTGEELSPLSPVETTPRAITPLEATE